MSTWERGKIKHEKKHILISSLCLKSYKIRMYDDTTIFKIDISLAAETVVLLYSLSHTHTLLLPCCLARGSSVSEQFLPHPPLCHGSHDRSPHPVTVPQVRWATGRISWLTPAIKPTRQRNIRQQYVRICSYRGRTTLYTLPLTAAPAGVCTCTTDLTSGRAA